jgi:hypothetical protein
MRQNTNNKNSLVQVAAYLSMCCDCATLGYYIFFPNWLLIPVVFLLICGLIIASKKGGIEASWKRLLIQSLTIATFEALLFSYSPGETALFLKGIFWAALASALLLYFSCFGLLMALLKMKMKNQN